MKQRKKKTNFNLGMYLLKSPQSFKGQEGTVPNKIIIHN